MNKRFEVWATPPRRDRTFWNSYHEYDLAAATTDRLRQSDPCKAWAFEIVDTRYGTHTFVSAADSAAPSSHSS